MSFRDTFFDRASEGGGGGGGSPLYSFSWDNDLSEVPEMVPDVLYSSNGTTDAQALAAWSIQSGGLRFDTADIEAAGGSADTEVLYRLPDIPKFSLEHPFMFWMEYTKDLNSYADRRWFGVETYARIGDNTTNYSIPGASSSGAYTRVAGQNNQWIQSWHTEQNPQASFSPVFTGFNWVPRTFKYRRAAFFEAANGGNQFYAFEIRENDSGVVDPSAYFDTFFRLGTSFQGDTYQHWGIIKSLNIVGVRAE